MTHATQETSIEAYYSIEDLGAKQKVVLEAFVKVGAMTNRELAAYLGWPINTSVPRVNELTKMGFIIAFGTKFDIVTKRRAIIWNVSEKIRQLNLFDIDKLNRLG